MAAGYGAGTYFFYRVVTADEWHRVHVLFPGIAVFTLAMGVATYLRWDAFDLGHGSAWLWVLLCVVTPVLIPALWLYNRRTDSRTLVPGGATVPAAIRWASGAVGVVTTLVLLVLFVFPEPMILRWPWEVSPLAARALLGWASVFSVVSLFFAVESRWSAARIAIESLVVWFGLLLLGFARAWDDVDPRTPVLWLIIDGVAFYFVGLSGFYFLMERG